MNQSLYFFYHNKMRIPKSPQANPLTIDLEMSTKQPVSKANR